MDKVICIGKNYLKHAQELGDSVPTEPLYFLKPPSTIFVAEAGSTNQIALPNAGEIHHEVELVLKLAQNKDGFYFSHYTVGLDLTIRDLQTRLKKLGQPWEKSKVFKNSSVLGAWTKIGSMDEILAQPFGLKVNNEWRQKGEGREMRFQPNALLSDVQKWFPICEGDIMFTGTPEGVGAIKSGDTLQVYSGTSPLYSLKISRSVD